MKRIMGFILFWIGIGMLIMLLLPNDFVGVLLILGFLLLGYNLFTC